MVEEFMQRYFKSISPSTPLYLSNGSKVTFDDVVGNEGIRAENNPAIIQEFEQAIRGQRGGIVEITSAQYSELKKKQQGPKSPPILREEINLRALHGHNRNQSAAEAAAAKPAQKMENVKVPVPHNNAPPVQVFRPTGIKR